ncbi:hypothetical protein V494_07754 [Pseudogymnoascus sp. VKM F-4513 (FW-928)]|nr:hypothetical protein V494_07754 [Pseudogymnoascus sp. VKM F-4513 (FW-928)]
MNNSILSIPVEILDRIFEHCDDFPQVIALASACKHTHSAWVTSSPTIIWSVANSHIRSFDDALMAVRATAIVFKAYCAGTLPTAVTMISLSGKSKLPNVVELKEVLKMQHLVRCIEYMYLHSTLSRAHSEDTLFDDSWNGPHGTYPAAQRRSEMPQETPGVKNEKLDSFRDYFYRAMYRLLLAGAVLARVYMAPLFQGEKEGGKNSFFMRFGIEYGTMYWDETIDDSEDTHPTEADIAYLRQFPVYNFDVADSSEIGQWRNREYETCFGEFASWIIGDGRAREETDPQSPEDIEPEWAENRTDIGAVRELMLLLVAYSHFNVQFENSFRKRSRGGPYMQKAGNRTVTIVRFGYFQVEEVTMPAAVEDLTDTYLYADHHPALEASGGKDVSFKFDVWYAMQVLKENMRDSGVIYDIENPGPPPMLELWHFALRRYLNLGFKSGTFWMPRSIPVYYESIWYKEVGGGDIFLNPNWAAVQKYKPGVVSWDLGNN